MTTNMKQQQQQQKNKSSLRQTKPRHTGYDEAPDPYEPTPENQKEGDGNIDSDRYSDSPEDSQADLDSPRYKTDILKSQEPSKYALNEEAANTPSNRPIQQDVWNTNNKNLQRSSDDKNLYLERFKKNSVSLTRDQASLMASQLLSMLSSEEAAQIDSGMRPLARSIFDEEADENDNDDGYDNSDSWLGYSQRLTPVALPHSLDSSDTPHTIYELAGIMKRGKLVQISVKHDPLSQKLCRSEQPIWITLNEAQMFFYTDPQVRYGRFLMY
eukprot:TRINITY_DN8135_c0_g1_i1.p1 TRINITY_DN8135_c0_g1~~TRINITY_DN8135_c0_g1_i1.p1  ORF type:complete len:270 (-),score=62.26 TRINITY_DN8135_c0_g1_i1:176-985(-)